jgi:hypothetical protein
MLRFSVKSLLFITTLVAAYVTISAQSKYGLTPAGVVAIVLYFCLTLWAIFRPGKDQKSHDELPNGAREGDEENPTT